MLVFALLIRGCESSATTTALKNYNGNVYAIIGDSYSNAKNVFKTLTGGHVNGTAATTNLAQAASTAGSELRAVQRLSVPSQMSSAQAALVSVMQMRRQAIQTIAKDAGQTTSTRTSKDALADIAAAMYELVASDGLYKTVVGPDIARALHADGIAVGVNPGEQQINPDQTVEDLGWLNPTWIAKEVGAQLSPSEANIDNMQPNLQHGDELDAVSVAGTTLVPGQNNTVPAGSARDWTLTVTDSGQTEENDVRCEVTVKGGNDTATAMIPTIAVGETTTCTVRLPRTPPTGAPYTVIARVKAVPLEKNLKNNVDSYTVTFN